MPRPRYTDPLDDPLYDSYDARYGDYDDDNELEGFSLIRFDDPEDEEDDDPDV